MNNILKTTLSAILLCSVLNAKCVRDDDKQIVTCSENKLMWQDDDSFTILGEQSPKYEKLKKEGKYSDFWGEYREALNICNNLTLGGYSDWRLPNVYELASLTDSNSSSGWNGAIKNYPKNTGTPFWTSSLSGDLTRVWVMWGVLDLMMKI